MQKENLVGTIDWLCATCLRSWVKWQDCLDGSKARANRRFRDWADNYGWWSAPNLDITTKTEDFKRTNNRSALQSLGRNKLDSHKDRSLLNSQTLLRKERIERVRCCAWHLHNQLRVGKSWPDYLRVKSFKGKVDGWICKSCWKSYMDLKAWRKHEQRPRYLNIWWLKKDSTFDQPWVHGAVQDSNPVEVHSKPISNL
jgi:hypothetical protein